MKVTMQCNCLSGHSNIYTLTSSWAHTKRMIFNIYCTVQWQCVLDSVDRAQCVDTMDPECRQFLSVQKLWSQCVEQIVLSMNVDSAQSVDSVPEMGEWPGRSV